MPLTDEDTNLILTDDADRAILSNVPTKVASPDDQMVTFACAVDRFTKNLFWNFIGSRLFLMEEYLAEQMSEKKFCSKIAPSLSSGPPRNTKIQKYGQIQIVAG